MKQFLLGLIGATLGLFIPCASYQLSRHECTTHPWLWILVAGGFLFSSFTVFEWAKKAFGHAVKAFGFVILTEGVLVFGHTEWLAIGGLLILAGVNAVATCSNMMRDRTEDISSETTGGITTLGLGGYNATPEVKLKRKATSRSGASRRAKELAAARSKRYRDRHKASNANVTLIKA